MSKKMTLDEAIYQLKDLIRDRECFLSGDGDDGVFADDIKALEIAVKALEAKSKPKSKPKAWIRKILSKIGG